MKTTPIPSAAEAAKDKIAAATATVVAARIADKNLYATFRDAENAYAVVKDASLPSDPRIAVAASAVNAALDEHRIATSHLICCEAHLKAAEREAERIAMLAKVPAPLTSDQVQAAYAHAQAAMQAARKIYEERHSQVALISAAIADGKTERNNLLEATGNPQAEALASLNSKLEILSHRLPEAEQKAADALEVYAAKTRPVIGHLNTLGTAEIKLCRDEIYAAKPALAILPLSRLVERLSSRADEAKQTGSAELYCRRGEEYLKEWDLLLEPMKEQRAALRKLVAGIQKSIEELDAAVTKALGQ